MVADVTKGPTKFQNKKSFGRGTRSGIEGFIGPDLADILESHIVRDLAEAPDTENNDADDIEEKDSLRCRPYCFRITHGMSMPMP
jgi:hypothetical protein